MLPVIRKIAERPGRVLRVRIDIIRSIVRKNHSKTTQSDIHAGIAVITFTGRVIIYWFGGGVGWECDYY